MPKHVAIIMDGNGRWAKKRGLTRNMGHRQGAKTFEKIAEHARNIGLQTLTVYAFSTENWKRPQEEISSILELVETYMDELIKKSAENVKIRFVGSKEGLSDAILSKMRKTERLTAHNTAITVNIAFNYGGREELVQAAKKVAELVKSGILPLEEVDEQTFAANLYTAHSPDPELIIRPSGELRMSNFLLWQGAYSEFVITDKLWPDFTPTDLDAAIQEYTTRNRRFGGL